MGDASIPLVGTGLSRSRDAHVAGRDAALAASTPLGGQPPALVLVFATPRYDLPALLAGVRSVTGDALLVGCTGSGELVAGEYLGFGGGVAVLAMTAGPYRFGAASAGEVTGSLDEVGQCLALTSRAAAGDSPHAAALLITDSLLGDLQQLVQGVYRVVGPRVALVGGGAGDEQRFVEASVFHGDQVLRKGALILWIASPRPLHVVIRHGWHPLGPPLLVTRTQGTEVVELGGRTAAAAYEELLGVGELAPAEFFATSMWHPIGLPQPDGTHVLRMARAKTAAGAIHALGGALAAGTAVQVMASSVDDLLAAAEEVVAGSLGPAPDAAVLLTFSSAARAMLFKERAPEEARRLQAAAGPVPTFGFHCCAEFARTAGVLGTHSATLVAVAL